jgi:hypothetical protein
MQNFGRGMWRRVGDFERIQVPQIIKHSQLQQALQYKEYITNLQQQKYIEEYRKKMLEKVNTQLNSPVEVEVELVSNGNIEETLEIEQIPTVVEEEIPIIEIIAVEPEIPVNEIPIQKEEKNPTIFPKKGRKRR